MLIGLGKSARVLAGRLVAFVYLFCVLAPTAALALGSGPTPCFDEEMPAVRASMTHQHAGAMSRNSGGMHSVHNAEAGGVPAKHTHHDKNVPGPCCALLCVSAMPTELPALISPSLPVSMCVGEVYRRLHSETPRRLYRPPIA